MCCTMEDAAFYQICSALAAIWVIAWILYRYLFPYYYYYCSNNDIKKQKQELSPALLQHLPPGPPAWPVIGHLHLARQLTHRGLRQLSRVYGPIMMLRLGRTNTVVISSAETASAVLKKYDHVFADRPTNRTTDELLYGSSDMVFSPHSPRWRLMRSLCAAHLLGPAAVRHRLPIIHRHVADLMVARVLHLCGGGEPVDVRHVVSATTAEIMCALVVGEEKREQQQQQQSSWWSWFQSWLALVSHKYSCLLSTPDMGELLPWLSWLDVQGLRRRRKLLATEVDQILDQIVTEQIRKHNKTLVHDHDGNDDDGGTDFVGALLDHELQLGRDGIKALLFDMFTGGTDTTRAALEWVMVELLRHPEAMNAAQAELLYVVGPARRVSHADMDKLPYVRAVVRETLRLHPPFPLLMPHRSRIDCHVGGYLVPRGSTVLVNAWAIQRDPSMWGPQAEDFRPERFLDGGGVEADVEALAMMPFSVGRRACPGLQLASTVVEWAVAELVHCFDWRVSDGCQVDDRDEFGVTVHCATPLHAVAMPRQPATA